MPSLDEIAAQQVFNVRLKLMHTEQGRVVAKLLRWESNVSSPTPEQIPLWEKTTPTPSKPIPRRLNAALHIGRRRKYAKKHERDLLDAPEDTTKAYVDGAHSEDKDTATVAWYPATGVTKRKKVPEC